MSASVENLKINLIGNLTVTTADGAAIPIKGAGCRAVLAVLATSRDMKRSRDWLKALIWSRAALPQAASSLRTALSTLRDQLGEHRGLLGADHTYVWLDGVSLERCPGNRQDDFFEDAPTKLGEPFDDWLRLERRAAAARPQELSAGPGQLAPRQKNRPCVIIAMPKIHTDDLRAMSVASLLCDQIIEHFRIYSLVDVFDLRDITSNQLAAYGSDLPRPDTMMHVTVSKLGSHVQVSIQCRLPATNKVLWTASISADQSTSFLISPDQLMEFANQAADSIHAATIREAANGNQSRGTRFDQLFFAIHHIMGLSNEGQLEARKRLSTSQLIETSAVAAAWYCFSIATSWGDADQSVAPLLREKAEHYSTKALDLDPGNPLVMALIAHVQGFVLNRIHDACELSKQSRILAPHLAIAWDLSAMNAVYQGEIDEAYNLSLRAQRLGRFSPYKPVFESSLAISAAVTGRHKQAINASQAVLARRPSFLPVLRHLCGSLAALGRTNEARECIKTIQRRDPAFVPEMINEPSYPVPSSASIALIMQGFRKTGLLN